MSGIVDQFTALVTTRSRSPPTISYVYGEKDTTGVPNVFASNETTLLNCAEGRFGGAQPWTVMAIGAALRSAISRSKFLEKSVIRVFTRGGGTIGHDNLLQRAVPRRGST